MSLADTPPCALAPAPACGCDTLPDVVSVAVAPAAAPPDAPPDAPPLVRRHFTRAAHDPYAGLTFVPRDSVIRDAKTAAAVARVDGVVVPDGWSPLAVDMLAQKYLRKAGVPDRTEPVPQAELGGRDTPDWLRPRRAAAGAAVGRETDARQVFDRLAGHWAYEGWVRGYFADEAEARAFFDETRHLLARQMFAPNSPQWFNTGVWWAYGIDGSASGLWHVPAHARRGEAREVPGRYRHPALSACFIQSVEDDLTGPGGIMDLWAREAKVFKQGGGSGANVSRIRGAGEPLSAGGVSSGLMSFLKTGDASAGGIKSGGTTRRAARMLLLDVDHPEIEDFIDWKTREEDKVACLVAGGRLVRHHQAAIAAAPDAAARRAAVVSAVAAGVPAGLADRCEKAAEAGLPLDPAPDFDTDWQGEAYLTVNGQNANNSVVVPDRFLAAVEAGGRWELTGRVDGRVTKTVAAAGLWGRVCRAAWASADPGVFFDDTVNDWNPVPNDDRIRGCNPCAEFTFVDSTSCNLASLNLVAFQRADGTCDTAALRRAARLGQVVLDISVGMAAYPSKAIAEGSWKYRPTGLGWANLGAYLMRAGVGYGTDDGRALAAGLAALVHLTAVETSAALAARVGPYPRFAANEAAQRRVAHNHWALADADTAFMALDLSKDHPPLDGARLSALDADLRAAVGLAGNRVRSGLVEPGFALRNAQQTCCAPTGTIGLLMDCDTTGIEPDFALKKYKSLAGGGGVEIVNRSVPAALRRLGYAEPAVERIEAHVLATGTVEGAADLKPEHLPVFDCATPSGAGTRSLPWDAHVRMLAAVQPFLSGSSSKTVNMPPDATVEDVRAAFELAFRLGVKDLAVYRDGSKLSQPLTAAKADPAGPPAGPVADTVIDPGGEADGADGPVGMGCGRWPLPDVRAGVTVKARVGGQKVYLRTGEYPDGRLGELFLTLHKEGTTAQGWANALAVAVSLGLQHGVPLSAYVAAFRDTRFAPNGVVQGGTGATRMATSVVDWIARELTARYLTPDEAGDEAEPAPPAEPATPAPPATAAGRARAAGYTGSVCPGCGSHRMRRAGACEVCEQCGTSGGCG